MSIDLKNEEAERLVAELTKKTGKGTTDLLLDLLRREKARLDEDRRKRISEGLAADRRLQEAWSRLPVIDPRPLDELIEYDENGLPV